MSAEANERYPLRCHFHNRGIAAIALQHRTQRLQGGLCSLPEYGARSFFEWGSGIGGHSPATIRRDLRHREGDPGLVRSRLTIVGDRHQPENGSNRTTRSARDSSV